MINAVILVQAVTDQIAELGQEIADLPDVTEVYSFAGKDVDLIAIIRVIEHEQLVEISNQLSKSHRVLSAKTHIASRHYSNMDIQAGFSIGFSSRVSELIP